MPGQEPIAVLGAGCRYAGGVASIEDLWRVAVEGVDAIGEFPVDRGWPTGPTDSVYRLGGFIPSVTGFDAAFFGLSPREARLMDPQQRLLLEVVWEALERAGIDADTLRGRPVGVFAGVSPSEYGPQLHQAGRDAGRILTGTALSVVAGRVAYTLGLTGPALSVDTACSSSLVAVHLAARALRDGECELAIAGGVSVLATPGIFTEFAAQGGLAADGRCKAFGAGADGTGWAEGAGVVVLARLADAVAADRPVWALIRGSAINQDGASNGLTAPSGPAQQRVIAAALADAGVAAGDVDAVEAHGTGTRLGDPIEATALAAAYRPTADLPPLWLGSIKSNIGHAQAASGVAGLLKMVEAVRHGVLPGSLHCDPPSGLIDWQSSGLALLTETRPWPDRGRPRRAGVSSFGISGTNAHVVVEQPPAQLGSPAPPPPAGPFGWPLSARSAPALAETARRLSAQLAATDGWQPHQVGFSLATSRTVFDHRAVVLGDTREDLLTALERLAASATTDVADPSDELCFVFGGHGSQLPGMGRQLRERFPVFAATFDEAAGHLDRWLPGPLHRALDPDAPPGLLDDTRYTHAAVFAYQAALVRLLDTLGVVPDVLVGHSLGEITAGYAAGVLTLPDACTLVGARGRLLADLPPGAMAAVRARAADVSRLLDDGVTIAAYNSPLDTVVSGEPGAVADLVARLRAAGGRATMLPVNHALHTPATEPVLARFREVVAGVDLRPATIPVISTLTGGPVSAELTDPEHWCAQIRRPVLFADAIAALGPPPSRTFLELAPRPVLTPYIPRCLAAPDTTRALCTGRRSEPEPAALLTALATVHSRGHRVRWDALYPAGTRPVDLPTYPFQRRYLWHPTVSAPGRAGHPLLGAPVPLAAARDRWFAGILSADEPRYLSQHRLHDVPVLPAAAMIEWALAAAGGSAGAAGWVVEDVAFLAPLVLPAGLASGVQAVAEAAGGVRCFARPVEQPTAPWTTHVTARRVAADAGPPPDRVDPAALCGRLTEDAVSALTDDLARRGLGYGPAFRRICRLFRGPDEAGALVEPSPDDADGHLLDPTVIDACFQLVTAFLPGDGRPWLPARVDRIAVHRPLTGPMWCYARRVEQDAAGECAADVQLLDQDGTVLLELTGVRLRPAARGSRPVTDIRPADLPPARPAVDRKPTPPVARLDLTELTRLAVADPDRARRTVLGRVVEQLGSLLQLAPDDQQRLVGSHGRQPLNQLGLDSLAAVQLQDRLLLEFGSEVTPEFLFDGADAADVAESVCRQLTLRSIVAPVDGPRINEADTEILTL
jgi:polyene macrolide polyketide synthase